MSETLAKKERAQARKLIGAAGLEVLGQHSQDVRLLISRINDLEEQIVRDRTQVDSVRRLAGAARDLATPRLTLWGRLRWLLLGR